jgi:hypothetical protein
MMRLAVRLDRHPRRTWEPRSRRRMGSGDPAIDPGRVCPRDLRGPGPGASRGGPSGVRAGVLLASIARCVESRPAHTGLVHSWSIGGAQADAGSVLRQPTDPMWTIVSRGKETPDGDLLVRHAKRQPASVPRCEAFPVTGSPAFATLRLGPCGTSTFGRRSRQICPLCVLDDTGSVFETVPSLGPGGGPPGCVRNRRSARICSL